MGQNTHVKDTGRFNWQKIQCASRLWWRCQDNHAVLPAWNQPRKYCTQYCQSLCGNLGSYSQWHLSKGHCSLRLKTKKLNLGAQTSAEQGRHTHFPECSLAAHSQLHYLRYCLNHLGGSWWCLQRLIWLWGNGLLSWILNNWMCSILRSAIWNGWAQSNPSTSVALGLSGSQWAPNAGTLEHSCTYLGLPRCLITPGCCCD